MWLSDGLRNSLAKEYIFIKRKLCKKILHPLVKRLHVVKNSLKIEMFLNFYHETIDCSCETYDTNDNDTNTYFNIKISCLIYGMSIYLLKLPIYLFYILQWSKNIFEDLQLSFKYHYISATREEWNQRILDRTICYWFLHQDKIYFKYQQAKWCISSWNNSCGV